MAFSTGNLLIIASFSLLLTSCANNHVPEKSVSDLLDEVSKNVAQENWLPARIELQKATVAEPQNRAVWIASSNFHCKVGEWENAISAADKALSLNNDDAEALGYRAWANSEMTNWSEALNDFNRALELVKNNPELYIGRANVYQNMDDFKNALADCKRTEAIQPDMVAIYQISSVCHAQLGDMKQAIKAADKAIALDPSALNYNIRGGIYNWMGKSDLSLKDLQTSEKIKHVQ